MFHHGRIGSKKLAVIGVLLLAIIGCQTATPPPRLPDYSRELPPGMLALRKLTPDQYPDFSAMRTDPAALQKALAHSLEYLQHPSSRRYFPYLDLSHDRAVATLQELLRITGTKVAPRWNDVIRERFDVYQSVGAASTTSQGYTGQVLFTGYFTPTYDASLTRRGPYQWPIYKRPVDLVADETGEGVYRRQVPAGGASPDMAPLASKTYWTRAEIERDGKLAGQELAWLKSKWEAYIVTIQGSARLRLPNGQIKEVGYAGSNGHNYPEQGQTPADRMLADGVITRDQRTLSGMGRFFADHPDAMDKYLWLNPRTVFFTDRPGGPFGKLNVPVTPGASLATDKQVYPRAMPVYVATDRIRGLLVDQDAGGAIRSAGRADIYMGIGEGAQEQAGSQMAVGQLYYLAIKPEFMKP